MSNFSISFAIPLLLLLIIPAIFFTLLPYFRLTRKYRRTRNRIVSMTLHIIIMLLCVSVLAGIKFNYDIPNENNEIIILVDTSYSNRESEEQKAQFVDSIIDDARGEFKIGIVAFGYNAVTVVGLTSDTNSLLGKYQRFTTAEDNLESSGMDRRVDNSATDIANALNYAKDMFTNLQAAKIVLISDGIETDGNALSAVKTVASEGIRIDTVHLANAEHPEVQLVNVVTPEANIIVGTEFTMRLTVQSSIETEATITIRDEDEDKEQTQVVELVEGIQDIAIRYTFSLPDMHKLSFRIDAEGDTGTRNNEYRSYIYLEVFNKILMLESFEGESETLKNMLLSMNSEYDISVVNLSTHPEQVPRTVDDLREYDQVILVNISNKDLTNSGPIDADPNAYMPVGFDHMLKEYVEKYGGGVFAVGGSEPGVTDSSGNPIAHAFNRDDMATATAYKDLLPVQAVKYTPPVGVVIIIDRSGSMSQGVDGSGAAAESKLQLAKQGALSCLNALTYRDYIGIMTLESNYAVDAELISIQNRAQIEAAIDSISLGGGTIFAGALERAGQALASLKSVERRHIILVTDGEPADPLDDNGTDIPYGPIIKKYNETAGVTLTIVSIGSYGESDMRKAAEVYGKGHYIQIGTSNAKDIVTEMRNSLNHKEITEVSYESYTPTIRSHTSVVQGINDRDIPSLGGFYGTRVKDGAETVLMAPYVPLYTQWNYGKGKVGAFMCSLVGDEWSNDFVKNPTGKSIVRNIVEALMPTEDISPRDVDATLTESNYTTRVNIYTNVEETQKVRVTVRSPYNASDPENGDQVAYPSASEGYSRATFVITKPGIYAITVEKLDESNNVIEGSSYTIYKTFSYSAEYNVFMSEEDSIAFLKTIASSGRGELLSAPQDVFLQFETIIHMEYDPRLLFVILSIVLLLLDIAVRKFKFSWPHEIVRNYKEKKKLNQK